MDVAAGTGHEHGETRYTHGHEQAVLASHSARTAANSAQYLLGRLRPGMSLLDVGFGPGTITLDLAEAVAPGVVTAIENTEAPFAQARANALARGDTSTRFEHADVMDMPFGEASFDVVHAHQVLQHLVDPVGALREMSRVCRAEGLVAARDADYAAMAWFPEIPGLARWRELYRAIALGNGAQPDAGHWMRSWASTAGLRDVQITSSNWCYADPASCRWWGQSQARRVLSRTFVQQALDRGVAEADIHAMAAAWRQWAEAPDAWFLIPSVEILAKPGASAQPFRGRSPKR